MFDFYFPRVGVFKHYASNLSVESNVIAKGGQCEMKVVKSRKITKIENFDDLIQAGSNREILNFLRTENLKSSKKGFSIDQILFMLKDESIFSEVIDIFREK